jgi:hemophore
MKTTTETRRWRIFAACAGAAAGGVAVVTLAIPSATATSDPCAASEVARTVGTVATSTGAYLDLHPETNQALTTISKQPAGPQSLGSLKSYFDAHPGAAKDMQTLQAPLTNLPSQCKLPISVPQLLALMQGAATGSSTGVSAATGVTTAAGGQATSAVPGPAPTH